MPLEQLLGAVMAASLTLYALSGGADFGGGVWDGLARGPRAKAQRALIAKAIGPIWEANHVWLIVVVVLLFVGLPRAYAAISTALHIPLSLMLLGVVLRGSAFVFRSHDDPDEQVQARWSLVFSVSSLFTPLMLGVCLGAVLSGGLPMGPDGRVQTDYVSAWLAPFPFAVGALVVVMFATFAAVYLCREAQDPDLREDFRRRGLGALILWALLAFGVLGLSRGAAPLLWQGLVLSSWALLFQLGVAALGAGALLALWTRRYGAARGFTISLGVAVCAGWALCQHPYALPPDLSLSQAAAPESVLIATLGTLGLGGLLLLPAFVWLYRVFGKMD